MACILFFARRARIVRNRHAHNCTLCLTTNCLVFNAAFKGQAYVIPEGHRDGVRTLTEGEAGSITLLNDRSVSLQGTKQPRF